MPKKSFLNSKTSQRKSFTEALFSRPSSLSELLPYEEYLAGEGIFLLKDGSLGAIYKMKLLEHETMTSKEIIQAVKGLKPLFSLPENCTFQVHFEQSRLSPFEGQLKKFSDSYKGAHPVSKYLFDERLDEIRASCEMESDSTPLRRSTYLSIRYFPKTSSSKRRFFAERSEAILYMEMKGFISELQEFKQILRTVQNASSVEITKQNDKELVDLLRRFFNPKTYHLRKFAPVNNEVSLSKQCLYNSPTLDHSGIEREGVKSRTLTLKTSPLYAYPGGMAYFLGSETLFPFHISLNFSFPSKAKTKLFFDTKEFFLEHAPTAMAKIQRDEIKEVQDRLARSDRCIHLTFNVMLEGETDEELDEKTQKILHIFTNKLECEVIREEDIGLGLALNSLPFFYGPDSDYSTARAIKILRSDAVKFLPVFDSFRGLEKPMSVFQSRENNLAAFSLLENETSNHTAVLADTGSGKSAFVIECLQAAKRMNPEPIVFIIDKKSSYSMLSDYYDGNLTVFDRKGEIPFSPFRGAYDEEKIAFLTKLISSAVTLTSPSFAIESEHQAAIAKALKLAYTKKCSQAGIAYVEGELVNRSHQKIVELTMDDFVVELASLSSDRGENFKLITEPLLSKLKPFYGDGIYAKFFKGGAEPSKKSQLFYIYDLDSLDGDPVLQTLMTMSVIEEIRQILSLPENLGRTGFIVMEEFAMLGRNNPYFRDFAIDFAETMRKRGCWLITLTPRPQNYFELEVGKAFWSVASNYVFMQMNSDNVDYIVEKSSLLDEASSEIVKSLRTIDGKHAEVFFINKNKTKKGAFKFKRSKSGKWMSPTNAKDTQLALEALDKFEDKWEALEFLKSDA